MTIRKTVSLLKTHQPKTYEAAKAVGIKLKYFASGAYKNTYVIPGIPIVVKFPKDGSGLGHALTEIYRLKILLKSEAHKDIAPKVYHMDTTTGVIVMKKYKYKKLSEAAVKPHKTRLESLFGTGFSDFFNHNFRFDGNKLKIIDLGL